MKTICKIEDCTGCGMCANSCPVEAITMKEGTNDFVYPNIDAEKCIDCGICTRKCPANAKTFLRNDVISVYGAWNKNKAIRSASTSGGIFTLLAEKVIEDGGSVVGCAWTDDFCTKHIIINKKEDIKYLRGSKYVQSITGNIYKQVKQLLDAQKNVLFSGTPCQNDALNSFLGKRYDNLIQIDIVCHGVPSPTIWKRHIQEINKEHKKIKKICLRYKEKYWDWSFVRLDYEDGTKYQERTFDDAYFNLFNVGYTLRESCHRCKYTSTKRCSDITLADFWGYRLNSFHMRDYQKGINMVLINTEKGRKLFEIIQKHVKYQIDSIENAKSGNRCLKEPFEIDENFKEKFWKDYNSGMTVNELNIKYAKDTFQLPKLLALRRLKHQFGWIK